MTKTGEAEGQEQELGGQKESGLIPVLPLRDIVIFPFMIVPLFVSRERSVRAVDQALADNRMIMLTAQRDLEIGLDRMLGQAEGLLRSGVVGSAERLVDALGSRDDDRAMMVVHRR